MGDVVCVAVGAAGAASRLSSGGGSIANMVADGDRCAGADGCCTAIALLLCAASESSDLVAAVAAADAAASMPKTEAV